MVNLHGLKLVKIEKYKISDNLVFWYVQSSGDIKTLTTDRCIWKKKLNWQWPCVEKSHGLFFFPNTGGWV